MSDAQPKKSKPSKPAVVELEINPSSGVDVVGDTTPPMLFKGAVFGFTKAESEALLAMRNKHGVPYVREVENGD